MNTETATELFLESRRSKRLSRVTIDTYRWALGKMADMFPVELPQNSSDIQRLFIENSDLSASSLLTIWNRLRIFWSWAEKEGICPNVMKGVPAPVMRRKLPRILRRDEVRRLLGSVEVERDYAILATLLDTGMRIGELASMTRESVSAEGVLVSGKIGDRMVPMSSNVMELVSRQGDERGLWVA